MSDNVEDGVGPMLQRIQERLSSLEAKVEQGFQHVDRRFDRMEREARETRTTTRYAMGAVRDVEITWTDRADVLQSELDDVKARLAALEHSDA